MLRDAGLIPLSHDHHHALALCVMVERALSADPTGDTAAEQARRLVDQFDGEIRDHFEFEEQVLFPALEPFPALGPLVARLMLEHRTMRGYVDTLRARPDRGLVEEFVAALRRHVRTEERELFEEVQRVLTREQLDEIGGKRRGGGMCWR
jgi:hemerythrin-like domain-containing protein